MKVTTKGRYGVNAMVELAACYGHGPVALREIAQRQHIPETYLEQLMNQLRRADLVISIRGAQGGYELSRPPEDISVGAVLYVLEGTMSPVDCVAGGDGPCRAQGCAGRIIWEKIYDRVTDLIDSISLAQLSQEYEDKIKEQLP